MKNELLNMRRILSILFLATFLFFVTSFSVQGHFSFQVGTSVSAATVDQSGSQSIQSNLPWYITRSAAITAYLLLFLLIAMGETMASGLAYKFITPPRAWLIHKYLGISFAAALLTHMVALLVDSFIGLNLMDIFIPFHSSYNPLSLAFGIIGFYFTVVIILSSIISRFQSSRMWRTLHFLVYPLFVLGLLHGLTLGTDSKNLIMILLYAVTGLIFLVLFAHRLKLAYSRR